MPGDSRKTLMRSLGEFFGEVWKGVRHDPAAATTQTLRRETHEQTRDTPVGRVTLRRTVVEEMRIDPPPPASKEQAP
ncbi:MAG: hypothetical protein KIS87_07380 [Phycisphaeraceae bacterium]|nr:hypothetical protein [Phycisphaeraceae bacterium]